MNESDLKNANQSPYQGSPMPQEKSAFEEDEEEEQQPFSHAQSTTQKDGSPATDQSQTSKRRLSDAMETNKDTSATSNEQSPSQQEEISPEEAQRRTDELIQKMMQEDQNRIAQA